MKKNLFKKSLSVFLAVLMIMSCWVFIPGEHNRASAADGSVNPSALTAIYNGSGDRGNSSRIVICSDGEAGNTTVGHIRFNISSFSNYIANATLTLNTGNHGGTLVNNCRVDIYPLKANLCQASTGTYLEKNIENVYGGNYNSATGVSNALNYYGISTGDRLGTVYQNAPGSHDIDVTAVVQNAKTAGLTEVCFLFIMPEIFYDGNGNNSWSDTHINVSGTSLSYTAGSAGSSSTSTLLNTAVNINALNSINTNVDTNMTTTSGTYHFAGSGDQASAATTDRRNQSFVNVLYSPDVTSAVGPAVVFSTVPNSDNVRIWYPETVLMYDGNKNPKMGILLEADASNNNSLAFTSAWMSANSNGLTYNSTGTSTNWKGIATNDSCFYYIMYDSSQGYCATTDGQNTSTRWATEKGQWCFFANHLVFNADMQDTEWVRTIKPTWKYRGGNGYDGIYDGTTNKNIYVMNIKGYRTLVNNIDRKRTEILRDAHIYSVESVKAFVDAAKVITDTLAPKNFVSTSSHNVTSWNSQMITAYNNYQNAVNGLTKRTFDIAYENLFSLSDWLNSNSVNLTDNNGANLGSVSSNVENGSLTFKNNRSSGEVYTTVDYGGNINALNYIIKAEQNETYRVRFAPEGAADAEMLLLFYNDSGDWISTCSANSGNNYTATFTAPAGATKIQVRFDVNTPGATTTFKDIAVYKQSREDSYGISAWKTRPYNNSVAYNTQIGSLDIPVREGGIFEGWYYDEAYTQPVSTTDVITGSKTVYAKWSLKNYTITYDANGGTVNGDSSLNFTVETPLEFPTASRDGHTFVGWMIQTTEGTLSAYNGGIVSANVVYGAGWTGNATLVAQWEQNTFTVTFIKADGSESTQTVAYGATPEVPSNTATAKDANGHTVYTWPAIADVTENVTYKEISTTSEHDWSEWTTKTNSTCTVAGTKERSCNVCGYVETGSLELASHIPGAAVRENEVAASCKAEGSYDEVIKCSVCGHEISRTAKTIEKLAHTEVTIPAVESTCTATGLTAGKKCSVCGTVTVAQQTIAALGHLDEDKNHVCDRGCGAAQGTCSDLATDNDHVCDYGCGKVLEKCSDAANDGNHKCDICGKDNITAHVKGEEKRENITDATCGSAGKYDSVYYCTECNAEMERTNDVTIAQLPHSWQEATYSWTADGKTCTATRVCANNAEHTESEAATVTSEVTIPATCTEIGTTTYTATFTATWAAEQTKDVKDIPANGHTAGAAATCTTAQICTVCDTVLVAALGHKFGETVTANDAICTTAGNYAYKQCTVCNYYFAATETTSSLETRGDNSAFVIPALGHEFTKETVAENYLKSEADCLNAAEYYKSCSRCGTSSKGQTGEATFTSGNALDHAWSTSYTSNGDGKDDTHYQTCTRENCDAKNTAVKHTWGEGVENPEADCENTGTMTYTCTATDCGATYTETVNALGHTEAEAVIENNVAPTCTATGSYETVVYCSVCKAELSRETTTVDALGHSWGEWETVTEATCLAEGENSRSCSVCNTVETKATEKLEHLYTGEYKWDNASSPKTHSQKCVNGCNEYGNKTECTFNTVTVAPTCDVNGYTTYTCSVCSNSYTSDYTTRDHSYVYEKGNGTNHKVTCEYADCDYETTEKCAGGVATCTDKAICDKCMTAWGENLGHSFTSYISDNNATCLGNGTETAKCDRCDATDTREDDESALGHSFTNYVSDGNATCLGNGTETAKCDRCDATDTREDVDSALGHKDENKDHKCDNGCDVYQGEHVDTDKNHICDYGCSVAIGACEDADKDHDCDYGCDAVFGTCEDTDFDHKCDYGCDAVFGIHADSATDDNHVCDYGCGEVLEECKDKENDRDHKCDVCGKDEITDHEYGEADCEKPATCTECGAETGTALGHSFTNYVSDGNATCLGNGTETAKCDRCDATDTREDVDSALGHKDDNNDHKCDNGCDVYQGEHVDTDKNHICDYGCSVAIGACEDADKDHDCDYGCNKTYGEHKDSPDDKDHVCDYCKSDDVLENCTDGDDKNHNCDICDKENVSAHEWVDADCTTPKTCSVCGSTDGAALNHNFAEAFTVDKKATCDEVGSKSKHCLRCTETTEVTEIPVRGHNLVDTETEKEATCLEDGVMNQKCNNGETDEYEACEHTATRVIPAKGHAFGDTTPYKAPTCSEVGNEAYKQCEICSKFFAADADKTSTEAKDSAGAFAIAIVSDAHSWDEGVVTTNPTCTEKGVKTYTCKHNSSHTRTEDVAALDHKDENKDGYCDECEEITCKHVETVVVNANPANCEYDGYSGDTVCVQCGKEISKGEIIPKTNHSWGGTPIEIIPATCSDAKTLVYKCRYCQKTENRYEGNPDKEAHTIIVLETIEPTCEKVGYIYYICTLCSTSTEFKVIEAKGHIDEDGDGVCDASECLKSLKPGVPDGCSCICHSKGFFMQLIYKIIRFFWKLFKISPSCKCGAVHY